MKFLFFIFLLIPFNLLAQHSIALYEAEVKLTHNDESAALKKALQQVVDRLTPGVNDHDNPIIQAAIPEKLLKSRRYTDRNTLQAEFEPNAIIELMNKAGQQPWLVNRPKLFVWVSQVLDRGAGITFRYPNHSPIFFDSLEKAAKEKGLELVFPSPYEFRPKRELNKGRPAVVGFAKMAQTLNPEAILYVELSYEEKGDVCERWQVYYRGHTCFSPEEKNLPVSKIGDYAIQGSSKCFFEYGEEEKIDPQSIFVNISNIQSVSDYNLVADYITHLPGIIHASVNSVTADAVLYKLDMKIPVSLLEMRLAQKFAPLSPLKEERIINYRLNS